MEIYAFEPFGFSGFLVRVEVDIRRGIPATDLVGLAAGAVRESRERVRAAIRNSGFEFPQERILINLSPADVPKEGSAYDLPIALKILALSGKVPESNNRLLVLGELNLDGSVLPVRGILPALAHAASQGIQRCLIPAGNFIEASQQNLVAIYPVNHLSVLPELLWMVHENHDFRDIAKPEQARFLSWQYGYLRSDPCKEQERKYHFDYSDYLGNEPLLRALQIAAAGRHNALLFGPPGTGKTMAAVRFPSLLPDLSEQQALEALSIRSLYGYTVESLSEMKRPPLRAPHHSASVEGMIGGGKPVRPGEISLAHHGVLFLDETTEFRHDVLQALREPIENGIVNLTRAGRTLSYPSNFQLLMAANPCPCGNLGNPQKTCVCSSLEIQRYWKKLGGPLMDRIDLRVPVSVPRTENIMNFNKANQAALQGSVMSAIERQKARNSNKGQHGHESHYLPNARLLAGDLAEHCRLERGAETLFSEKIETLGISVRSCHAILKIARTIADIDGKEKITEDCMNEALHFRQCGDSEVYLP